MSQRQPYGIPTKYKGVQFRSRLEARWAAFFDLCGWQWTYEPIDLDGWIPDFMISDVLIEVKPHRTYAEFGDCLRKIFDADKWQHEILLLGVSPFRGGGGFDANVGWLCESAYWDDDEFSKTLEHWIECFANSPVIRPSHRVDFCHELGSYSGRATVEYYGSPCDVSYDEVMGMWAEACNATQWKPRAR